MKIQFLNVIKDAMDTGILISSPPETIVNLTYLGSTHGPNTHIAASLRSSDEENNPSKPPVLYSVLCVVPLVVGLSVFLSYKKRFETDSIWKKRKGYHAYVDETEIHSKMQYSEHNSMIAEDENTNSINSCETEGEFVGSVLEHPVEFDIGLVPPPAGCQLSPETQCTEKVNNRTSSKKTKPRFEK